ncbi:MAG: branched-chain amino acid transport system ATP-binding protein [Pseudonocardiales bacterium]|jgi:branched-chain amino acid transport system ATP-binding protein|nr:branched-chain amino acid transport system ATP-binding protein [Pseudonocardiales bacterium]MDT4961621.1 branched-chain amino acid transport system ATP-binding protein [Pseudonocardiales bacterium]MDT4973407.1 branched-chain amino acid transport system ATP-binding protein [Pseudonocardiales bacterium]MDT4974488.1 branched-chain amino acid transport system ATP-binding protein [Pseudonocardiales bacterium]
MAPILTLDSVFAGYGAGDILKGVDLQVEPGTVTCLIGPNGAGKSTVLKTISGLLRPSRGSVMFGDRELNRLSPKARLLLGIVHVPQERSLFPAMSVWDNLLMGGYVIADHKAVQERIAHAVEVFPICAERAREHAGSLSGGEQKQVELARTLVLDPSLILLDEPSIGLDPKARRQVFDSIRSLAAMGRTVLLVEQNARSGLAASDFGAVLESGVVRLVATGASLLNDPEVARLYLGAAHNSVLHATAPANGSSQ